MNNKKKNKIEFSKIVVFLTLLVSFGGVILSYILALNGADTNETVTVSLITECIAVSATYFLKSYGEKNSINKYGKKEVEEDEEKE